MRGTTKLAKIRTCSLDTDSIKDRLDDGNLTAAEKIQILVQVVKYLYRENRAQQEAIEFLMLAVD